MKQTEQAPLTPQALAALVEQAKGGSQDAYTAIYRATSPELYRSIHAMVRSDELSLDIQQDTYVFAFTHLDQLGDPSKLRVWLRSIALNRTRSVLRKQTPVLFTELEDGEGPALPELADESPDASPELRLEQKETTRYVREILDSLTAGQRMLVGMYYYEQLPVGQIARELEISPGTVKSQLYRSRKKIEQAVQRLEKQGVKLYGLSPLPYLLALLKREEPPVEAGRAALRGVLSKAAAGSAGDAAAVTGTGLGAGAGAAGIEAAAVHVGRRFFQTFGGRVVLGLLAAAAVGGGVLGYGWARDKLMIGDVRPPTDPVRLEYTVEPPAESEEDLTTEPLETVERLDTPEDLSEPSTEPTEPDTEPTEPEPSQPSDPEPTQPTPGQPADPEPTQPTQPQQPQPSEPEPTEPSDEPTEPSAAPEEPTRIVYYDTGVRLDLGDMCYYHVNVVGGAVPTLYTDHPELLRIEYNGTYTGGNLKSGETGHHWEIDALDVGTASLFCTIDGQTQTAGTVTVPLPAIDWNPNMPPVSDVIIDFEEETEP